MVLIGTGNRMMRRTIVAIQICAYALFLVGTPARLVIAQGSPPAGACNQLQAVFVVDQSGSMFGDPSQVPPLPASDPQQLRLFGTQRAVDTLGTLRYQSYRGADISVAVLDFGDTTALRLPWTHLTPTNDAEQQQQQQTL